MSYIQFFRDLSLIEFHFVPVPNCSERKPFIRSQYLNCFIFVILLDIDFLFTIFVCLMRDGIH